MDTHIDQGGPEEDKRGKMLVRRLLRVLSTISLAMLAIILVAVVGLYVYEPSPAEGFAFSSCDEPTIYPGEGHSVVYYRYEEIIQAMLTAWE